VVKIGHPTGENQPLDGSPASAIRRPAYRKRPHRAAKGGISYDGTGLAGENPDGLALFSSPNPATLSLDHFSFKINK
jgi:hypothetical protein